MTLFHYRAFGLTIGSEFTLPDLPLIGALGGDVDVVIANGKIAAGAPEPVGLSIVPDGALLNIPETGRYLITGGDRITVDPAPATTGRGVRLFLLGSAFAAILHQRGLLPLHANTINFGGVAVAFMGHSGAGKSTLASWFHDRGRPILGDDVCVVTEVEINPLAVPGLPRIRLWADALSASGRTADDYERSFDDTDKYDVPLGAATTCEPLPLAAVYLLEVASADQPGSIERLTGVEAIEALVANTYRGAYLPMMGGVGRHLTQCVALARRVPVFRLRRRWDLAAFAEEATLVEKHVHAALAGNVDAPAT